MHTKAKKFWQENRRFIALMALLFVFRSSFADWSSVPTGSMKPTIVEGDQIIINKMAYDIRVPFSHISLLVTGEPARGDIIVFDSEVMDKRLVKRVVAVPGDRVSMQNNVVLLNGKPLNYQNIAIEEGSTDWLENLPGREHAIRIHKRMSSLSSFDEIIIPEGFVLGLGDNRDNSADSRVIGLIPRNEIVGRANRVLVSFNYDEYYWPRSERFLKELI